MPSLAVQALRRTVTVDWPRQHAAQAKVRLLQVARDGHAQIMRDATARGGIAPEFDAYANRPGNSNLESVILPGPIIYRYRYFAEIVDVALDLLRRASPVDTGDYVRSHTIYLDGTPVETLPRNLSASAEIMIANPVPYSRKLEIGKTKSGRDFLVSPPNRIYERVRTVLASRYGNLAKITFGYVTPPDAYRLVKNNPARRWLTKSKRWYIEPKQRADRAKGAAVRSPAIFIERLI